MNPTYKPLFESLTLPNGIELKNRIVMAPMTHSSSNPDGTVSDAELAYYERRARGISMLITACTHVIQNGIGFQSQFASDSDDMIPSLRRLATTINNAGARSVLQLFHGGRQSSPKINSDIVSASAVPSEREGAVTPRELTDSEVEDIIRAFGEATRRAIEAGFDGVELHGANGYLLQQFFSPHSNRRTDKWGGSLEKRMAFPLALIDEVQRVVHEHAKSPFIVGYRFSPEEMETPGITMAETLPFVDVLADKGLDYLHVSLNDFWSLPRRGVADTRSRMEIILEKVANRVPVIGVGAIKTADDALRALQTGCPLIALGREIIVEPDWVQKVQEGREDEIQTTLTKHDQAKLVVPDPLWKSIINVTGWFPVVEEE